MTFKGFKVSGDSKFQRFQSFKVSRFQGFQVSKIAKIVAFAFEFFTENGRGYVFFMSFRRFCGLRIRVIYSDIAEVSFELFKFLADSNKKLFHSLALLVFTFFVIL